MAFPPVGVCPSLAFSECAPPPGALEKYAIFFIRPSRRIGENRSANSTQECVVAVWVLFNSSGNEQPRCN